MGNLVTTFSSLRIVIMILVRSSEVKDNKQETQDAHQPIVN